MSKKKQNFCLLIAKFFYKSSLFQKMFKKLL